PISPGTLFDFQYSNWKTATDRSQGNAVLKLVNDGVEAYIDDLRMPVKAAMLHLVEQHGFDEATAKKMLKTAHSAHLARGSGCRWAVKYASPFLPSTHAPPAAPP